MPEARLRSGLLYWALHHELKAVLYPNIHALLRIRLMFSCRRLSTLACRRMVLPPVAVSLVPNEDSWSELAKQFLRRDSFLGQRGRHSRRKKKGGHPEGPPCQGGGAGPSHAGAAQSPAEQSPGRRTVCKAPPLCPTRRCAPVHSGTCGVSGVL